MTARDQRSEGAGDEEYLLLAALDGRAILTRNVADFLLLHRAWRRWSVAWRVGPPARHAGILILPQPPRAPLATLATEIDRHLAMRPLLHDSVWVWTASGGWRERR
ncbi:MAG: hypothetical protein IT340_00395 [Chloroflexi bacterium]|nr:hypothetical protein [Chloroflexota bacterium]